MKEDMERNIETSLGLDGQAENPASAVAGSGNSGVTSFEEQRQQQNHFRLSDDRLDSPGNAPPQFPPQCELQSKRRVKAQMAGMEKTSFCLTSMDLLW